MTEGQVQVTQGFVGAAVTDVGHTGASDDAGGGVPVCVVHPAVSIPAMHRQINAKSNSFLIVIIKIDQAYFLC
jgi:hypothetical protein